MFSRILYAILFIMILNFPLYADVSSDELYDRIYGEAVENLQHGNAEQRIMAAYILGAQRKQAYVRVLSRELLSGLDNKTLRKTTEHGPYVKSQIAWALGRIGHMQALPSLVKALNITIKIIEEDIAETSAKREELAKQNLTYPVILDRHIPGPTHLKKGYRFPDSPDVYWSLGDDFKATTGANPDLVDDRVNLKGYNFVNVALSIIDSIGEIALLNKHQIPPGSAGIPLKQKISEARDLLVKLLSHNLVYIRGGAALALGQMGDKEAIDTLEKKFQEETDLTIKTQIARSILWNDRTKSSVTKELLEMLKNDDFNTRLEASRALRDVGLGETLSYLLAALDIEEDKRIQVILKEAIYNAQIDNVMPVNY